MDNAPVIYDLIEQLERLASQLERLADGTGKPAGLLEEPDGIPPAETDSGETDSLIRKEEYLSRFLENLPTWNYNCLRRRMIPANLAAKMLGISPVQLSVLTSHGRLRAKGGRYDLLSLLMWLDSVVCPTTKFDDAA